MPEPTEPDLADADKAAERAEPLKRQELVARLAEAVLAVDGVIRLEPTIRNRLRQLSGAPLHDGSVIPIGSRTNVPDGVAVKKIGDRLNATIEVAIRPFRPAAEIAEQIQQCCRRVITESGWRPGSITVSVLAIEGPAG